MAHCIWDGHQAQFSDKSNCDAAAVPFCIFEEFGFMVQIRVNMLIFFSKTYFFKIAVIGEKSIHSAKSSTGYSYSVFYANWLVVALWEQVNWFPFQSHWSDHRAAVWAGACIQQHRTGAMCCYCFAGLMLCFISLTHRGSSLDRIYYK